VGGGGVGVGGNVLAVGAAGERGVIGYRSALLSGISFRRLVMLNR